MPWTSIGRGGHGPDNCGNARVSDASRNERGRPFVKHHETVLELSYQASINDWLTVQPDFQYIFNPGAVQDGRDAMIAGLRFTLTF